MNTERHTGAIDIATAIDVVQRGELLIICDHPERENEGDFFVAAEKMTVQALNIMIQYGRGLVCCPLTSDIATRLKLEPQTERNTSLHHTQFTVSIDSRYCDGSGISSIDRARTITSLADARATADDFVRPGHIFPIVSHSEGITKRGGHTEAAIALLQLADLASVGVICEIIADSGHMANEAQLQRLASTLNIGIVHVEQIKRYYMEKKTA